MYGAILGDIIGSPYEFDCGEKTIEFDLFSEESTFTDDSVMTVAVAEALMDSMDRGFVDDDAAVRAAVALSMCAWARRYPHAGYGGMFGQWLRTPTMGPYNSWGNGSAMRVSAAGWLAGSMFEARRLARLTAEVTHNHLEGIKGAEATAAVIFAARTGATKDAIREMVVREFGYDLSRTCNDIRPGYHHVESCMETVPEAVTCFFESADYEEAVRLAVSLGGDTDTMACIAGSMAEAYFGVPEWLEEECRRRLPEDMLEVVERFGGASTSSPKTGGI